MAGLVPAIHVFPFKTGMPATPATEATPFFERLCAGMTQSAALCAMSHATRH
jgi:hypothetical protein